MFTWRFHKHCNTDIGPFLEKFQKQDSSLMHRVKGFLVDSASVADADPTLRFNFQGTNLACKDRYGLRVSQPPS
ncbi:unnamed protein product [Thlaspi arvense]|uniref:Uncharacterized protein n=1 Tax=Thlaspi arvense TaxID=13288 RepID=A0AAU9RVM7_THLAR|nr:unnamed protein product [Thlaspi arvense]